MSDLPKMTGLYDLLNDLADGRFQTGEQLARRHGLSRAAINKAIRLLIDQGIEVEAVRERGYRLPQPVELLDRARVFEHLTAAHRTMLVRTDIFPIIDSTNAYLMASVSQAAAGGHLCLAEQQTGGRGRNGRRWISPFGANLYMSLSWLFERKFWELSSLPLAVGIAMARGLHSLGVSGHGLKWPNDLFWQERKLGGILVETSPGPGDTSFAVIGIGLNVNMPPSLGHGIEQPWVDLRSALGAPAISRNLVAARILPALLNGIMAFEEHGSEFVRRDWPRYDLSFGRTVEVRLGQQIVTGRAQGIDVLGRLVVAVDGKLLSFTGGEVSLRLTA